MTGNRVRLRPAHAESTLKALYPVPHNYTKWLDHQVRVAVTAQFTHALSGHVQSAADLSCGDGTILKAISADQRYFGDFAPGYDLTGPIEQTIDQIPPVDLFICCETVEHLDDPDLVLKQIRAKTRTLVLSTPVDAFADGNREHYWAWNRMGVEAMAETAGFTAVVYNELDFRPAGGEYSFGIWWLR